MPKRRLRPRLAVLAMLSLLTLGALVSSAGDQASTAPSTASASAQLQWLPAGAFGWD